MTLSDKYRDKALKSKQSAIKINLSSNPAIRSLLPAIRSSSRLIVLDETDDYIVVGKFYPEEEINRKLNISSAYLKQPSKIQKMTYHRYFRKKSSCFEHYLKAVGIEAEPIRQSSENSNKLHIVNASGIIR